MTYSRKPLFRQVICRKQRLHPLHIGGGIATDSPLLRDWAIVDAWSSVRVSAIVGGSVGVGWSAIGRDTPTPKQPNPKEPQRHTATLRRHKGFPYTPSGERHERQDYVKAHLDEINQHCIDENALFHKSSEINYKGRNRGERGERNISS